MNIPICPYCGRDGRLVKGLEVYPHRPDLATKKFWLCEPCFAFVGVHDNSKNSAPYGTMAKPALRRLRSRVHAMFDPIWKRGHMSRKTAYIMLARALEIDVKDCHIGQFNKEQCLMVIRICEDNE